MQATSPDNPMLDVPTQAERETAYPRVLKTRGALAHTEIVEHFDTERQAERQAASACDFPSNTTASDRQSTQLVDL